MASTAPTRPTNAWRRLTAWLSDFVEAADMDGFTYHDMRIARLEQRIALLESEKIGTEPAGADRQ